MRGTDDRRAVLARDVGEQRRRARALPPRRCGRSARRRGSPPATPRGRAPPRRARAGPPRGDPPGDRRARRGRRQPARRPTARAPPRRSTPRTRETELDVLTGAEKSGAAPATGRRRRCASRRNAARAVPVERRDRHAADQRLRPDRGRRAPRGGRAASTCPEPDGPVTDGEAAPARTSRRRPSSGDLAPRSAASRPRASTHRALAPSAQRAVLGDGLRCGHVIAHAGGASTIAGARARTRAAVAMPAARSVSSGNAKPPSRAPITAVSPSPARSSLTLPSRMWTTRSAIAAERGSWLTTRAVAPCSRVSSASSGGWRRHRRRRARPWARRRSAAAAGGRAPRTARSAAAPRRRAPPAAPAPAPAGRRARAARGRGDAAVPRRTPASPSGTATSSSAVSSPASARQ